MSTLSTKYDLIIIGGGIVGLATAFVSKKQRPDLKILVLEKEKFFGIHQSSRNSGVIHSGIYYTHNSLKSKLCIAGSKLLVNYCDKFDIQYNLCGKLIVANSESEINYLHYLHSNAAKSGLQNVRILSQAEALDFEPYVLAKKALLVPSTGIIDYKVVVNSLIENLKRLDVCLLSNENVIAINNKSNFVEISTENSTYFAKYLVTCAGLQSDRVSSFSSKVKPSNIIIPFRGEYYDLTSDAAKKIRNLIYPTPNPKFPFLGVHLTRMISGKVECGPNAVLSFSRENYRKFSASPNDVLDTIFFKGFFPLVRNNISSGVMEYARSSFKYIFLKSLQRLVPSLKSDDLIIGNVGLRAQAVSSDGLIINDFLFKEEKNILHLINAPSPAATSCFAIADTILKKYNNSHPL